MRAGQLRTPLTLEEPTPAAGAKGGSAPIWTGVAEVFGAVEPISGEEVEAAGLVRGTATHRVTIRFHPGVTSKMRLRFTDLDGDRTLEVVLKKNLDERDRTLELLCRETT